jgi:dsDNA-binding SOS-regulon protein
MSVTMIEELRYVTNAHGKRTAVILSLDQYDKLLDDAHDLAVINERMSEEPITLEEMKERLIT